jgi:hypothetical protein
MLTERNVAKLDMQVHETPRTKVLRYFAHEESPLPLNRINNPITPNQDFDQWELPALFSSSNPLDLVFAGTVVDGQEIFRVRFWVDGLRRR